MANILVCTTRTNVVATRHISWAENIPQCICGPGLRPLGELTAHHSPQMDLKRPHLGEEGRAGWRGEEQMEQEGD